MKIAIDISPLSSGHKVRGIGFYVQHLKSALEKSNTSHEFVFFTNPQQIPQDIDIIHYPYFDPFHVTLPIRKKHKIVITIHDLIPIVFPEHFPAGIKGRFIFALQKYLAQKADAIIVDSHCSKKDVMQLLHIPTNKVVVAYLAAGDEFKNIKNQSTSWQTRIKTVKNKYHLPEKFALYIGDVTWNKNVPLIIEACQLANIPLVLVGKALAQKNFDIKNKWNKDLLKVKELIKTAKNISILGFIPNEDIVALYNMATVFVFPSLYEGFGLPILEAMACGCPVVTSHEGPLPEVAGEAALYADAYNSADIAQKIKKIITDTKLQQELSRKGIVQAQKFSWEKTAAKTIEIYERL